MADNRFKKKIIGHTSITLKQLTDPVRNRLEKVSGIRIDSDQSLSEALDVILKNRDDEMTQKIGEIERKALRKSRTGSGACCSLCGRSQKEVSQLFAGQNDFICDKCIEART